MMVHFASDSDESTNQHEQVLLRLARTGDPDAKHQIITSLLETVARRARRYVWAYGWASPHLNAEDLAQDAYVKMLNVCDKALDKDNPYGYLLGTAYAHIQYECYAAAWRGQCLSLDAPASPQGQHQRERGTPVSLGDLLPDSLKPLSPYAQEERDYTPLYHSIDALPTLQREAVVRLYGIYEHAPEDLCETSRSVGGDGSHAISYQERKARATLYFALAATYPHYVQENIPLSESRVPHSGNEYPISSHQRTHLEAAYARLEADGSKITVETLKESSGVKNSGAVCTYLQERREVPLTPQQRLDEAYTRLQAQGHKVTADALRKEAHINQLTATMYLKHREPQRQLTQQQRLDEAYTRLQAQGHKVTVVALTKDTHIDTQIVCVYLKHREPQRQLTQQQRYQQRLDEAYTRLQAQGHKVTADALRKEAHTSFATASAYLREHGQTASVSSVRGVVV